MIFLGESLKFEVSRVKQERPGPTIANRGLRIERGRPGGRSRKTKPIRGRIVQNEPNFAPLQAADGGNCVERSQTWVA
jgi:hypothetical protein